MKKKDYLVTLLLSVDHDEFDPPDDWSWPDILDMPYEDVILEDVVELEDD